MNAIVIYKSKTGFTKKYAEWIAEAISCKAISVNETGSLDFQKFDTVVFGGWFFAGSVQGFKDIKEKLLAFKGKKIMFVTGATPPESPEAKTALDCCVSEDEKKTTKLFYLQGGLDYSKMGFVNKMMMKMMCSMMKKQYGMDSTQYKTVSQSFDATNKNLIQPITDYINS